MIKTGKSDHEHNAKHFFESVLFHTQLISINTRGTNTARLNEK